MTLKLATSCLLSASLVLHADASVRIPLRHKHVPFVRTRMRGDEKTDVPVAGSNQRFGEYSIDVVVGRQIFSLILDTGSSDLAIGANGCHGCAVKINRPYDPIHSRAIPLGCDWCGSHKTNNTQTSCRKVQGRDRKQCTFITQFEDESGFSAALYNDTFTFADGEDPMLPLETHAVVGAMYRADFPNPKMVDGIIGFGFVQNSATGALPPFSKLVQEGKLEDVFAICLHPNGNGGHLYLGSDGPDESTANAPSKPMSFEGRHILDTEWTPMLKAEGTYGVGMKDIRINGTSIRVPSKVYDGSIVDSGTQDVAIPAAAFKAVKAHFEGLCKKGVCLKGVCNCEEKSMLGRPIFENRCVRMSQAEKDAFPMIEVEMDGVTVQYPPSNYLKNGAAFCENVLIDTYTIAISNAGGGGTILGESLMEGYLVVHDRKNSRMGFQSISETDCPGMYRAEAPVVV